MLGHEANRAGVRLEVLVVVVLGDDSDLRAVLGAHDCGDADLLRVITAKDLVTKGVALRQSTSLRK